MDFWKGLTVAMAFITVVYIVFGAVVSYFISALYFSHLNDQCWLTTFLW